MDANIANQHNMEATILVVDDESAIREMLSEVLLEEGYRVVTAQDGLEAMERIEEEPPDLVVSDVMMPVLDGGQLAGIIRARNDVPVIGMTALSKLRRGADAYFSAVLHKPFSLARLLQAIEELLAKKRMASHVRSRPHF
jgi:CheY-like chemotaxis protein